jgi:hypothetical protein
MRRGSGPEKLGFLTKKNIYFRATKQPIAGIAGLKPRVPGAEARRPPDETRIARAG